MTPSLRNGLLCTVACFTISAAQAQINPVCPSITFRNNSNGSATTCPGINSNAVAPNVAGTSYGTAPVTAKTGNIRFALPLINSTPYVITRVYQGNTLLPSQVGPPSPMAVSNREVNYCFYDNGAGSGNLPTSGTVTFLFQNPQNTAESCLCAYDFSNNNIATAPLFTLPVVFTFFTAQAVENKIQLGWQTSTEENAAFFQVEQSSNGSNWTAIGQVTAKGFSSAINTYQFTDAIKRNNSSYYRLKQVDADGRFVYTDIKKVEGARLSSGITIQQNPVSDGVIVLQHSGEPNRVQIISLDGRLVWNGLISGDFKRIEVNGWNKGIYMLKWEKGTEKIVIR